MTATLPPDFLLRSPTRDDAQAIVDLLTIDANTVDYLHYTVNDLLAHWQTPDFNTDMNAWVVLTAQEEIIGYAFVQGKAQPISIVCVHPDYRTRDIWPCLFACVEHRARQQMPTQTPITLSTAFNEANAPAKHYVEQQGYRLVHRAWLMQIDLDSPPPPPQWPKGIMVRAFLPGQDEHLAHEVIQEAFQISQPFEEWEHTFTHESFDPTLWFFALDGERVAGAIFCYNDHPQMGWIWDLAIRPPWRRRGIGMALLQHAFNEFYTRGQWKIGLDVNAENQTGATHLYRQVGMQRVREYYTYEKELRLET